MLARYNNLVPKRDFVGWRMNIRRCLALLAVNILVSLIFIFLLWHSESYGDKQVKRFRLKNRDAPILSERRIGVNRFHQKIVETQDKGLKKFSDVSDIRLKQESSESEKRLSSLALGIFKQHGLVLVTFINNAYLPFAISWLCNTEPFVIHRQVLVLTTDQESKEILTQRWPEVTTVSLNITSLSEDQTYLKAGYVRVTVERTRSINRLLKLGIRLLLFEFDCAWLSNPLQTLKKYRNLGDIVATKIGSRNAMAAGFLLLNPTSATVQLWNKFTEKMEDVWTELSHLSNNASVDETLLDQVALLRLVRDEYAGVKVAYLPTETFVDGEWYTHPRRVRNKGPRPVIINNNFIRGNAKKIKRARKFGHWFLKGNSTYDACDRRAVKRALHGSS